MNSSQAVKEPAAPCAEHLSQSRSQSGEVRLARRGENGQGWDLRGKRTPEGVAEGTGQEGLL